MVKFQVFISLPSGDFFKKVSFYTKAVSLERWPGRDMVDM